MNWEPALYDQTMKCTAVTKINKARKSIIQKTHGRVLEIGSGTGVNFPLYSHVDSVNAIEPNPKMIAKSLQRKTHASIPIEIHEESAEALPFPDDTFDSVVSTLVFCTIPNPMVALKEIQRVAKPEATILFLEHVKVKHPVLIKIQDLLTPVWKVIANGCHLNRNTLVNIKESDLEIKEVTAFYRGLAIAVECVNQESNNT